MRVAAGFDASDKGYVIVVVCRRALAEGSCFRSFERGRRRQGLVDKRIEQRELVLVVQIERAAVDVGVAADIRHRHLREADLGKQREERLSYDQERIAPATIDFPCFHGSSNCTAQQYLVAARLSTAVRSCSLL